MDTSTILQLGASAIQQNGDPATKHLGTDQLTSALGSLLGSAEGKLDFGALLAKMQAGGLGNVVTSWLGNGEKEAVSPDAIVEMIGSEKVVDFASQLGLPEQSAKAAIADALPAMVEKAAPDIPGIGNLVESAGGLKGVADVAKKLF
jgi:uncharacterized protein YidB (DUF937 family)